MTPTRRAAIAVGACAVLAVVLAPEAGVLAFFLIAGAFGADVWMARRRPEVVRTAPAILPRGHPMDYSVAVVAPPGTTIRVRQPTPADLEADPAEVSGPLTGTLKAYRRGSHRLPPVAVRVVGPLGFGAFHHRGGEEERVTVYPDVITARRLAGAAASGRFVEPGLRRGRAPGIGTEFEAIRDYVPDDDVRQVNWKATMRAGSPMTNDFRIDQDRDVLCLIDSGRLMGAPLGGMTRLDAAVDAAAAIAYTADRLSDRVGVIAFDGTVIRHVRPKRRGGDQVVEAIYDLEPSTLESDYETAFRLAARSKRSLVIVFTDLLEESAAAPLLDAVPVLARKHHVVVAGSVDPDLVAATASTPSEPLDVYRAAAALTAIDERARVVRLLSHASARVLEAAPGALPSACVASYLEAKARALV